MFLNYINKPSPYLCSCLVVWGVISACTAATVSILMRKVGKEKRGLMSEQKNAVGAIMYQFFLGAIEAAFFPGLHLLPFSVVYEEGNATLSHDTQCSELAAQAFGGLIAAEVLTDMGGKQGIAAWRWLFIIEGAITVVIALLAMFVLPDYPNSRLG
jgi:hypothetical protein